MGGYILMLIVYSNVFLCIGIKMISNRGWSMLIWLPVYLLCGGATLLYVYVTKSGFLGVLLPLVTLTFFWSVLYLWEWGMQRLYWRTHRYSMEEGYLDANNERVYKPLRDTETELREIGRRLAQEKSNPSDIRKIYPRSMKSNAPDDAAEVDIRIDIN